MLDAATEAERSDQLRLLADSATAFASGRLSLTRARKLRGAKPEFDPAMLAELAGQGWTGLLLPEELGGFGLGFAEAAVVIERVSAQLAPEPLVPVAVLATGVLRRCAAGGRRDALLSGIANGSVIPGLGWQSPEGGLDRAAPAFTATKLLEGSSLSGEVRFIRPGSGATHFLLAACSAQGIDVFVVESGAAGLKVVAEPQADGTALARVSADGLRVAGDARLNLGADDFAAAIDEAVLMNAVELLALIRRMRAMTQDYLKTRVQFGKPIGSFQALQHRAVDLLIQEELTAACLGQAIAAFDTGTCSANERSSYASRAKARAAEAATWTAREAMQMHGGIGVTDEYDLSLYVNRTLALAPWLGNAAEHRRRYVRLNPPTAGSDA